MCFLEMHNSSAVAFCICEIKQKQTILGLKLNHISFLCIKLLYEVIITAYFSSDIILSYHINIRQQKTYIGLFFGSTVLRHVFITAKTRFCPKNESVSFSWHSGRSLDSALRVMWLQLAT